MNKETYIRTGLFFLGAALGSLATYKYMADKFNAEWEKVTSEWDATRTYEDDTEEFEESVGTEDEEDYKPLTREDLHKSVQESFTKANVDYTSFAKPDLDVLAASIDLGDSPERIMEQNIFRDHKDKVVFDDTTDEEDEELMDQNNGPELTDANKWNEKPRVISDNEFSETHPEYSKVSLIYYEEDDVMSEEQNESIFENEGVLLGDCINYFGHFSGDKDMVYVRNDKVSTDYEITRVYRSYNRDVLGYDIPEVIKPRGHSHGEE